MQDGHEDRRVDEPGFPSETRQQLGPWLRALAGLCLAAAVAGGVGIAPGGSIAGAHAQSFAPAPSEPCPLPSIGVAVRAAAPTFQLQAFPDDKQVHLTWQQPASGTAFAIYDWPAQDSSKVARVDTASGSDYVVKGLTNGTTYCFVIVRGQLPYVVSNVASATPAAGPGAPNELTAKAGNSQVTLSWTAPVSDGGSQVSGYNVFEGTTADLSGNAPVTNVTGTTVTLPALINGTTYYFEVAAVNGIGEGPPSNEASAVPLTVPGAPTGLTATPGNSRVTLSWAAPTSGGAAISGYLIFEGTRPGGENRNPVNGSPVTATSYTVPSLTNGTTYYFRVIAVNAAGQGPLSAETPATLLRIMPTSPPPSSPTSGTTTPSVTPRTSPATTAQKVSAPKWLITLLTAAAAIVVAGALALIRRRFRSRRPAHSARAREQIAIAQDVRAVPDKARPDIVSVHDTGREPTHTVRLEPHPGTITTTIKEGRP